MKENRTYCQICDRDITDIDKYLSDLWIYRFPLELPKQMYVALECRDVWRKKLKECLIDGTPIKN